MARIRNSGPGPDRRESSFPAPPVPASAGSAVVSASAAQTGKAVPVEKMSDRVPDGVCGTIADKNYRLGGGDRLRIRFLDRHDRHDLDGEYVVGESGQLRLPRIGVFDALGKTPSELEHEIRVIAGNSRERLGYFSIDIVQCRPFYVTGLVNRPGPYPYVPGYTVLHALAIAGGLYHTRVEPFGGSIPGRGGAGQVVSCRIMRRDRSGEAVFEQATETDPIMPGDMIQIECQAGSAKSVQLTSISR